MRREAEERYNRFQRRLADLDDEIEQIRARARERAAAESERIVADARQAAERIGRDARLAVEQELRRARRELRDEAADLSIELAGRMLRERVSDADRDRLLDEFIGTIESPNGSGKAS